MIPDNQLVRGIQSRSVLDLGTEPSNTIFFSDFDEQHFFAHVSDDFNKKKIPKKICRNIFQKNVPTFFHYFRIFWNAFWSSREKKNRSKTLQYGHLWWFFGQFSKNFEYKIDHFSKKRIGKLFFIGFRTLRIFYSNLVTFEWGRSVYR